MGAAWWVDRTGLFRIRQVVAPLANIAVATYTENDILSQPRCVPSQDPGKGLPVYSTIIGYAHNGLVQTGDAVAGGVSVTRRTFIDKEWRTERASDGTVQTVHLLAIEMVDNTYLAFQSDASTEATRRQVLRGTKKDIFELDVRLDALTNKVDLCDVIIQKHNARFGLSAGVPFLVIGVDSDAARRRITFKVWG